MIKPISWLDIFFFAAFLIPNLIFQISAKELFLLLFVGVPYALFILPLQLVYDRFTTADDWTLFQVFVLRIVRFSFGNLSATVGRVFFSESVAFPFAQFRVGGTARKYTKKVSFQGFRGYWICDPAVQPPAEKVLIYVHGGGFTMGSTAFYLEFLINIVNSIPNHSLRIFSLEYSLVPEARYPTQIQQLALAYEHILTTVSPDNIILAGDSAGATIIFSFLLHISRPCPDLKSPSPVLSAPQAIILISPWCQIDWRHSSTSTSRPAKPIDEDFLDATMLDEYARLYTEATDPKSSPSWIFPLRFYLTAFGNLGHQLMNLPYTSKWITRAKLAVLQSGSDPRASDVHTSLCNSPYRNPFAALQHEEWLRDSLPKNCLVIYGEKEIMAGDIIAFTRDLKKVSKGNIEVHSRWKLGWHVWPLVAMYLGKDTSETESGVKVIGEYIKRVMDIKI